MNVSPQHYFRTIGCFAVGLAILILLLIFGYGKVKVATQLANERKNSGKVQILVAVEPMAYLAERVGGDRVEVAVLTPHGRDPETFAPTPRQLAEVVATRVFFTVGLPVEKRFGRNIKSIAPDSESVDLAADIEFLADPHRHNGDHEHGDHEHADHEHADHEHGDHEHADREHGARELARDEAGVEIDPHLWTSPANARVMVARIAETLCSIDPASEETYRANAAALDEELAALQAEIAEKLAPYEGRAFVVFHPAYGYFAREFKLTQLPIEYEGKAPQPRQLEKVIARVKQDSVCRLIIQPEFNRSAAQVVANETKCELLDHSPLEKDYFVNLRLLTDEIVESFTAQK